MLYLFDRSDILIGQLKTEDLIECTQEEVLNGTITISFTVAMEAFDKMNDVVSVAHKDVNNSNNFYLYKLIKNEPTSNGYGYEGIYVAFDDLKGYGYIKEKIQSMTADNTLRVVLADSRWSVGDVEISNARNGSKDTNFYYCTRLDAVSKIIELWGLEVGYGIEIDGNKVARRTVNLYEKKGVDTFKRFVYGENALEVVRETSFVDLYTAAVGRGKDISSSTESPNGNSRKVDFTNITWQPSFDLSIMKPRGDEYLEFKDRTKLYGYSDGSPRYKILEFNDIEDPVELLEATYKELEANSRPQVQFKLTAGNTEGLDIGDTVTVVRKDLDIYYNSRVFKIKRNLISKETSELEFGDNIDRSQARKNMELSQKVAHAESRIATVASRTVEVSQLMAEKAVNEYKAQVEESQKAIQENIDVVEKELVSSMEEISTLRSGNVVLTRSMADNIIHVESMKTDLELSKGDIAELKEENVEISKDIEDIKTTIKDSTTSEEASE